MIAGFSPRFMSKPSLCSGYLSPRYRLISSSLQMGDRSCLPDFIKLGARVRVAADVAHRLHGSTPYSSRDMIGRVSSVWEKCDVDPTCCCAELASDAPVEVEFNLADYPHLLSLLTSSSNTDKSRESMIWKSNYSVEELDVLDKAEEEGSDSPIAARPALIIPISDQEDS
jgi:hypothetical protein